MTDKIESTNEQLTQTLLERLTNATVAEQRRNRRWGIFFKSLFFLYLLVALSLVVADETLHTANRTKPHTALIEVEGVIQQDGRANADDIVTSLNEAFKDKGTKAIILRINSPGGSPVQSAYIYDEILRLRKLYPKIKIYAVCTDICASGAYYIAAAADDIYANPSSIIGSIGVLMDGFGFVDTLQKLGVQRRLYTAGAHKGFLDPFSPVKPEELAYVQRMLNNVHQQFINSVKAGRGKRLKDSPELFSGLAWDGTDAKALGLIDHFGSAGYVAREVVKNDNIVDYTLKPNYLEKLANKMGASFAHQVTAELGLSQYLHGLK